MGGRPLNRVVFLDRDGVINKPVVRDGRPYPPGNPEEFEIYPDVASACARLKNAGFLLVVVTNQPDVGEGIQSREVVEAIHAAMCAALPIDRVEVCYERGETSAYKPAPGMLLRAARDLAADLASSYMVGDRWRDIDCGYAAGCTTIWIDRGYLEPLRQKPHFRVDSLAAAADRILRHETPPFPEQYRFTPGRVT